MIIVFFGAPGVGKGTQAVLLAEKLNIPHLSTGDAFRKAISNQTEVGLLAKQFVEAGALVPDEVVTKIVAEALSAPEFQSGVILDGFPRTITQANGLNDILSSHEKGLHFVINISVPTSEIVERMLKRGRKDDAEDVIRYRLQVYEQETAPLLEFYQKFEGLVKEIDGNGNVDEVHERVIALFS